MSDRIEQDGETTEDLARQRDRDDLQDEIAGRETGRQKRFLVSGADEHRSTERRRAEEAYKTILDMLLATDPEYRRLYLELGERLSAAETEADAMIDDLRAQIEDVDHALDDLKDRAARLPDGTRVFKTADGSVIDEHGREVPAEMAEGVVWPPNAPGAEEYLALKQKREELEALLERWIAYRNGLGDIRDRYEDPDNPMTKEEMEQAIREIEAMSPKTAASNHVEPADEVAPISQSSSSLMPTTLK